MRNSIDSLCLKLYQLLDTKKDQYTRSGISYGHAGLIPALLVCKEDPSEEIYEALSKAIDGIKLNIGQPYSSYDVSELALIIAFLEEMQDEGAENENLLTDLEGICAEQFENDLKKRNFDPICGYIKFGYYYLFRFFQTGQDKYLAYLKLILDTLEESSVTYHDGGIFWISKLFSDDREYLGNSHGQSSILQFLLDLSAIQEFKTICFKLSHRASEYIYLKKTLKENPFFPIRTDVATKTENPSLNLCYGDLGVLLPLLQLEILNKNTQKIDDLLCMINQCVLRIEKSAGILDQGICYGRAGVIWQLKALQEIIKRANFKRAIHYSILSILDNANFIAIETGYLPAFTNNNPSNQISFSEGIAGIIFTLKINDKKDAPLLKFIKKYLLRLG